MATDLRSNTSFPFMTSETVGTSWVTFRLPFGAQRADIYFVTNSGDHSFEIGVPTIPGPIPADTWFLLWERPLNNRFVESKRFSIQVRAASADTTVYVRVN